MNTMKIGTRIFYATHHKCLLYNPSLMYTVYNRPPLKITPFSIQSACDGMHERGNNFPFHYPIMVFPVFMLVFLDLNITL